MTAPDDPVIGPGSISYDPALPVVERRDDILEAIRANPVVVISGATGSGKSTQLPKMCLELGRGEAGRIAHTQPRRLAARTLAQRVASELGGELGERVGYRVRFTDRVSEQTQVKFLTDGMLLAEVQSDPDLRGYDTVIVDEAHERSLNIDFLIGYLRRLVERRPELRVIITSATIDPERFARHFGEAPVLEVSGRTYPVEVRYRPPEEGVDTADAVVAAVQELCREGPGDVLAFFSGEREIRETAEALRKAALPGTEVLPLYARLSAAEQQRAFQRGSQRRIVLATNVAETSVTVPGVRYVVDTGQVRMARYSQRTKVSRLPIEPISQASADQRAGRCGREGPGICIRLYTEDDYAARPRFTDPEILRTNLAAVVLQMKAMRLGDIERFPFIDPPERKSINDGIRLLQDLQALDEQRRITGLGRELARLPVDPGIGRMLLEARERGVLRWVRVIAAGLSIQDPRERPLEAQAAADEAHAQWANRRSDFLSYCALWEAYRHEKRHRTRRKLERWCREHFLSPNRMREWTDVHRQIIEMLPAARGVNAPGPDADAGSAGEDEAPAWERDFEAIHRSLLSGLIGQVAHLQEEREYLGARGIRMAIHPASALAKRRPRWILAAELVETSRLFAREVAEVHPEWVEDAAGHRVSRTWSGAHFSRRASRVMAYEKVTLYGLTLVSGRRVHYGPIDPEGAREIFIREGLVHGALRTRAAFLAHNQAQVEEIEALEAKARRRDLLVDEAARFAFYDARLPAHIHNGPALEKWLKKQTRDGPDPLKMDRSALLRDAEGAAAQGEAFPDSLPVCGFEVPLVYALEPGSDRDGVRARVPVAALNALRPEPFEWLVPGLRHEKVTAMIRGLPKALRKHFVPAPDFARAVLESLEPLQGSLCDGVARALQRMTGVTLPAGALEEVSLPDHLVMHFEVHDGDGHILEEGSDLAELQRRLGAEASAAFAAAPRTAPEAEGGADAGSGLDAALPAGPGAEWYRSGVTTWDFGELPERVALDAEGWQLQGYPAIEDHETSVTLTLKDAPDTAERTTKAGVRRLFMLALPQQVRHIRRQLPQWKSLRLVYHGLGSDAALRERILFGAVDRAFLDRGVPRDRKAFEAALSRGRGALVPCAEAIAEEMQDALERYQQIRRALKSLNSLSLVDSLRDVQEHLDSLIFPDFLETLDAEVRAGLPRYLQALNRRVEKLQQEPARDRVPLQTIRPWWERWRERAVRRQEQGRDDPALQRFRVLLEEYRVSLFAQEVGTRERVSEKRIRAAWDEVA